MEAWSMELPGIQPPPVSERLPWPAPHEAPGHLAARLLLFVLHPNTRMEVLLFPLSWERAN